MSELPATRAVLLHPIELQDTFLIGMADDDFTQCRLRGRIFVCIGLATTSGKETWSARNAMLKIVKGLIRFCLNPMLSP